MSFKRCRTNNCACSTPSPRISNPVAAWFIAPLERGYIFTLGELAALFVFAETFELSFCFSDNCRNRDDNGKDTLAGLALLSFLGLKIYSHSAMVRSADDSPRGKTTPRVHGRGATRAQPRHAGSV